MFSIASAIIPQYTGPTDRPRDTIHHSACTKSHFARARDAADNNNNNNTRDYFDATASNWNTSAYSVPGKSLCIKTGNQIGGWVLSRFDHVIRGGPF